MEFVPNRGIPKSLLSRASRLVGAGMRIGAKELSHRLTGKDSILSKQIEQAELLVQTLSQLKGAAMKTGQLLSLDAADLLPPEVLQVFAKLQNQSPHFMPLSEVHGILSRELSERASKIENLSERPIAAASIGQVHLGRYGSHSLAVKIQYPGIAESVETDLSLLQTVVDGFLRVSGRSIDTKSLFQELNDILKQEVDYQKESEHLQLFRSLCSELPHYHVPQVYSELSSSRVLSMSFESGIPLKNWMETETNQKRKDEVGKRLLELYCREFFDWGKVQTDPNPGNFFIKPEDLSIVLLDFGALKSFSPEFITTYRSFVRAIHVGEDAKAMEIAYELDFLKPEESPETKTAFLEMIRASLAGLDPRNQPFDFSDDAYFQRAKETSLAFTRLIRFTAPPHRILFLHRKLAGVYSMLRKLKVKQDLSYFWQNWIESRT